MFRAIKDILGIIFLAIYWLVALIILYWPALAILALICLLLALLTKIGAIILAGWFAFILIAVLIIKIIDNK